METLYLDTQLSLSLSLVVLDSFRRIGGSKEDF